MFYGGKYDAQNRYDEWNTTQIKLKLNNKTDQDILAWIKKHTHGRDTSVQGAIKSLIREDIAHGNTGMPGSGGVVRRTVD